MEKSFPNGRNAGSLVASPRIFAGVTARKMRRFELLRVLLPVVFLVLLCSPAFCAASSELVTNGLLSQGRAGQPAGWQPMAYFSTPDAVKFSWEVDPSGIGALKIVNMKANDSRWVQDFPVSPSTWYHISGWIRAQNVDKAAIGAHLSVAGAEFMSSDLRGTANWQLVEFWVQSKPGQKVFELECRLGSFSALAAGTAYFTAISVSEGQPPRSVQQIYGGKPWELPADQRRIAVWLFSIILTVGVVLLIWRFVLPRSSRIPP